MRPLAIGLALWTTAALSASEPPAGRLSFMLVWPYPGPINPFFSDPLTDAGGCEALYISSPEVCTLVRDEPGWIDLSIQWSGSSPIRLRHRGESLVRLHTRKAPAGAGDLGVTANWSPGQDLAQLADADVLIDKSHSLGIRVSLSALTHSRPVGIYELCFQPNFTPETGVQWEFSGDIGCYRFELLDQGSIGARLERLRRKAIDKLVGFKCSEAAPLVDEMLDLDAENTVAYRLRGIIAELDRRQGDAIAEYTEVVTLLRAGRDSNLHMTADTRKQTAEGLEARLLAMQLAQGLSLLGNTSQGPACH